MPAILWDGVDDQLLTSAFQAFPSKRGSMFVVFKQTHVNGTTALLSTYPGATTDWIFESTGSGTAYKHWDGS
jgi:hypothetical protein